MDILAEHFIWDKFFDERWHCKHCSYDTQLLNAAIRHFNKKHAADLAIDQSIQQEPEEPDPWHGLDDLDNLEEEL